MNQKLWEIIKIFTRLGVTAFGGPIAHIALMRHEFVHRQQWLTDEKFVELIGITNLIPGPNSTEMAIHLGYGRGGWRGSVISGICFILPAALITLIVAWCYARYGQLPQIKSMLFGIKPAIIAIIVFAVYPLLRVTINSWGKILLGSLCLLLCFVGFNEIYLMLCAGIFVAIIRQTSRNLSKTRFLSFVPIAFTQLIAGQVLKVENLNLFGTFLKIGAILYGSGYVLFAFLDSELVRTGFLTKAQLMDAIAVGQMTPGPVFSAVTFIGFQIAGVSGAIISTVAIFLPSFIFVIGLQSMLPKLQKSKLFSFFLSGVNIASITIIFFTLIEMSKATFVHWSSATIALSVGVLSIFFKQINSAFLVLWGAAVGYLFVTFDIVQV